MYSCCRQVRRWRIAEWKFSQYNYLHVNILHECVTRAVSSPVIVRDVVNCALRETVLHFYSKGRPESINFKRSSATSLQNEIERYISRLPDCNLLWNLIMGIVRKDFFLFFSSFIKHFSRHMRLHCSSVLYVGK